MKRLCAIGLAAAAAACAPSGAPQPPSDPSGSYQRIGGAPAAFTLSRLPTGLWQVETQGTAPAGERANACHMVAIGSLDGARLVATSDRDGDSSVPVTQNGLAPYQGFILDFTDRGVDVSGPEADMWCDLRGRYRRR